MQEILDRLATSLSGRSDRGMPANYIPELASVDTAKFGIAVCMADGRKYCAGDAHIPFSIQSVSKVFSLALVLGRVGDALWHRVGREPSGTAFNSIVLLEQEQGRPRNPFINAGAIVTTDELLSGRSPKEALGELVHFLNQTVGEDITINASVASSENKTGHRNRALASFLMAYGNLKHAPDLTLGTYFHQCAIEMTTLQLAKSGRFLIGSDPFSDALSRRNVRRINALMMTCGHYDGSGDFAYRVGIPGKSGVGGGILAIVPGKASVAVWSPGLNRYGNSKLGTEALEVLARRMGWSVFG
ncbi:MAG: glutaminase [Pseudomonadota bacterium]